MTIDGTVVYPATIERAVYGMAGVLDAGAVEVGGRIVLAIVEQPDARVDLIATTGELVQRLTPAERPAVVRIIDAIPRNQAGKIIRSELRDRTEVDDHWGVTGKAPATTVPAPGEDRTVSVPPRAASRSAIPCRPVP